MTAPTPYDLAYSFQAYQIANPTRPLPADKLETEFAAISLTTDQIIANLALIQRTDGALANNSVGYDQLKVEIYPGFSQPHAWVTSTAYVVNNSVYNGSALYRCIVAHTSGTFATDLAAGKWELLIDLTSGSGGGSWGTITGTLSAQTDLQAALDAKQAAGATLASLEGLSLVAGDILYATAADTLARLPKGADGEFLRLASGLPDWEAIPGGGDALVANSLAQFAATTSLELKGVISDETGSGALVFATSPTLVTPILGTPTSGTLTNCTIPVAGLSDASANGRSLISAADYAAMRTALGLVIGTNVQAYDADLTTWAGISPSANVQSLAAAADYAAMRTLLGLVIGTNVQAYDADLTTWAGLTPSANAQSLVTAANYSAMRTLLTLVPGTDVQAFDSDLATIASLTATTDSFLQSKSSAWTTRTIAQVKTDLGVVAASDTVSGVVELATDAEAQTGTDTVRAITPANLRAAAAGKKSIWIDAAAMRPRATSGAGFSDYDSGSNDISCRTADFDTTTQEYAHFKLAMPDMWNEGTVTFKPYWTNTGGSSTQTVVFSLAGAAFSDDDALNGTAPGTVQTSSDTWLAQNDLHVGPESSAITIAGTPAAGDLVVFQVSRVVASDNMAGDARLLGLMLFITTNAFNEP